MKAKVAAALFILGSVFLVLSNSLVYGYATKVVDGDTVYIDKAKIRLYGIDTPEKNQQCKHDDDTNWDCGLAAKKFLEELVKDKQLLCMIINKDPYHREVAICYTRNGIEINSRLVEEGLAVAYEKYSTRYLEEQGRAKAERKGIWSGPFQIPEEFRRNKRRQSKN